MAISYSTAARTPARLAAEQQDAAALAVANEHRVKKAGEGQSKKKLNPPKSSRRGPKA